jgi:hypothetical protein
MSSQNDHMTAAEYRSETQSEEDIHKAVVEWADRQAAAEPALEMLFHVPNGGSRHIAEATKLKAMGTRQGVPDLLLPVPRLGGHDKACERIEYNGLALELKSPSGRLRPEQLWWLKRLKGQGWAVAVAWSFAEAHHLLQRYLDGAMPEQDLDLTIAEAPGHVQ